MGPYSLSAAPVDPTEQQLAQQFSNSIAATAAPSQQQQRRRSSSSSIAAAAAADDGSGSATMMLLPSSRLFFKYENVNVCDGFFLKSGPSIGSIKSSKKQCRPTIIKLNR